ncbi:MAG TPA: toll/interleukin-1 receptor domain-containing protein [Ktedonobacterales bacterium]|jgi:hypothetical protein|nr:toll/interleukin-1 receptor domain-containing protein [Ktedonobacterales bacterium]
MLGNGNVFISHAPENNAVCATLDTALTSWRVDHWFLPFDTRAGDDIAEDLVRALGQRDVLIRLYTPATRGAVWMERVWWIFRALTILDHDVAASNNRTTITISFPGVPEEAPYQSRLFIDAYGLPDVAWLDALRTALGVPPQLLRFLDDDAGFFWWIEHNPTGYVLNPDPSSGSSLVHRATCGTMSRKANQIHPDAHVMTHAHPKICSLHVPELVGWAGEQTMIVPQPCLSCRP